MTFEGGREPPKCHVTFLDIVREKSHKKPWKSYVFVKWKCHTTGGGGTGHYHQMSHGGGGLKSAKKSVTNYLNYFNNVVNRVSNAVSA